MLACIDIPALPLQIVLREHEDWRADPVVVVAEHKPLAPILWSNRHAREHRIFPGMRFGSAQALSTRLHAEVVSEQRLETATNDLFFDLLQHSPRVEPSEQWPGVFWIDASGLEHIYESIRAWCASVQERLLRRNYITSIVVGTNRFFVFALARTRRGIHVFDDPDDEKDIALRTPLRSLHLSSSLLAQMNELDVHTLGAFLRLPYRDVRASYGEEAASLYRLASEDAWAPLNEKELTQPVSSTFELSSPDDNQERLVFAIKFALHDVVRGVRKRCEVIASLTIELILESVITPTQLRIEPAKPTLDTVQLIDLIRLRLAKVELVGLVERIAIEAQGVRVSAEQICLLEGRRRDLESANRALARIRASFGRSAVVEASLCDAILPEARFRWKPTQRVHYPTVPTKREHTLVRRILSTPRQLPDIPKHEPERWLGQHGAVVQMHGPFRISGGWWARRVTRDYYFIETQTHELLWVYYDAQRQRWMLHGMID